MKRTILALCLTLLGVAAMAAAQGAGGAFVPSFNYLITGQWTWANQTTPWIIEGAVDNASETSLTFTEPTADRTITFPNASGTVMLGSSAYKVAAGTGGYDGANSPTSITTGLSALTACSVTPIASTLAPSDAAIFTTAITASAGRLDVYQWATTGSLATNASLFAWICTGTA